MATTIFPGKMAKTVLFLNAIFFFIVLCELVEKVALIVLDGRPFPDDIQRVFALVIPGLFVFATYRKMQRALENKEIHESLAASVFSNMALVSIVTYSICLPFLMPRPPLRGIHLGSQASISGNSLKNVVLPESTEGIPSGNPIHVVVPTCAKGDTCAGVHGRVHLKITVGADGSVERIMSGSGDPRLVAAWSHAVMHWKYTPFIKDGHPVSANITLALNSDGASHYSDN